MLKTAGIFLILLSGAGIGFSKSRELTLREKNLRQFLQLIVFLRGEIRCGSAPLPEAFREIAGKLPGIYGEFLGEVSLRLRNSPGCLLEDIFEQCFREKLGGMEFSGEERELICSLGGRLGYLDREMQLRQLELCEEETQRCLDDLRKEMPEKKKIYQSLGVLGGILLAVLLW